MMRVTVPFPSLLHVESWVLMNCLKGIANKFFLCLSLWFVGGVIAFNNLTFRPARSRLVVPEAETCATRPSANGSPDCKGVSSVFQLLNNDALLIKTFNSANLASK